MADVYRHGMANGFAYGVVLCTTQLEPFVGKNFENSAVVESFSVNKFVQGWLKQFSRNPLKMFSRTLNFHLTNISIRESVPLYGTQN